MLDAIKTFVSREFSAIWNLIRQIVELKQDATNCKVQSRIPNLFLILTHSASQQWTADLASSHETHPAIPSHSVVR